MHGPANQAIAFTVNGKGPFELSVEPEALVWRPIGKNGRLSRAHWSTKSNDSIKGHGQHEDGEKKRLEFAQIVTVKRIYSNSKVVVADPIVNQRPAELDKASVASGSTVDIAALGTGVRPQHDVNGEGQHRLKRLKIYYAKRVEKKSSRKLIKLKRIYLENFAHRLDQEKEVDRNEDSSPVGLQGVYPNIRLDEFANEIERQLQRVRQQRPKSLLIFINPFGGKGKALSLFKSHVRHLLELAQIQYNVVVTKYANHARDMIEDPEFKLEEEFDGIICIGGDGMFSELMNGLLFRTNNNNFRNQITTGINRSASNDQHLDGPRPMHRLLSAHEKGLVSPQIPIGVIGAGSTDANLFGFIGTNDPISAALNIILGQQIQIDVCSVHSWRSDRLLRFVSTFIAYGYFGDVIRESERFRWLGPSRYDFTAVNNLIKYRAYDGLVRLWQSNSDGSPFDLVRCHRNCSRCLSADSLKDCKSNSARKDDDGKKEDDAREKLQLIECQGPFMGVNAAVTACRCPQTRKGFSPGNHLANGCADLILVRPSTRLKYINYLLRTGYTKKSAFDLKFVEAYRCRQFEFVAPGSETSDSSNDLRDDLISSSITIKSDDRSSTLSSSTGPRSGSEKTNSLESTRKVLQKQQSLNGSDQKTSREGFGGKRDKKLDKNFSSWNADGEILNEQSIRVRVNKRLLRVFGTGEPEL